MMTAKDQEDDKVKALDMGADDYITKPIDDEEMLFRIKALLRRAKIVSERKINIGEVVIDYDSLTDINREIVSTDKSLAGLYNNIFIENYVFDMCTCTDEAILHNYAVFDNCTLFNLNASAKYTSVDFALDFAAVGNKAVCNRAVDSVKSRHIVTNLCVNGTVFIEKATSVCTVKKHHICLIVSVE